MREPHSHCYDVVIAGAGPVGLFLACELRLARLSVLVLEQAQTPHSPLKNLPFGMRGLSVPSVDALTRRGLLHDVITPPAVKPGSGHSMASAGAHWEQQARRPGGHFAGIPFFQDDIDTSAWPYRLPNQDHATVVVEMAHLESVLAAHAIASGVEIRRGLGVDGVAPSDEHVIVHAGGQIFHARWLVGCDGGRSTVRKLGGFAFVGTDPAFTGYSVQVELADPEKLQAGRHYTPTGMYTFQAHGTIAMVDFDGGAFHRIQPITLAHVQAVLRRVSCTDVTVATLHLASTWTDRACQATVYRRGRVLLAGDAAHIHSPLGGQGLNLGLGDAMNLGWKLAATIRGDAPAGLLDSYERERHPVGAQVLDWSRAQVALMRPSPSSRALAAIVRDLIATRDGATYFAERVWGVSLRYAMSDSHPLVGRSVPDFELVDGRRVGDLLDTGTGLLLDFDAHAALRALAGRWRNRISYVFSDARNRLGLSAMLVRPDGIVAWACNDGPDHDAATRAAWQWFGEPDKDGAPA